MKIFRRELILVVMLVSLTPARAASVKVIKTAHGTERVCLENDLVRLQINPGKGARVLMSCGGALVLTLGGLGTGKVCCFTAPPLGNRNFCDTPQWQDLLVYVLGELGLKR